MPWTPLEQARASLAKITMRSQLLKNFSPPPPPPPVTESLYPLLRLEGRGGENNWGTKNGT